MAKLLVTLAIPDKRNNPVLLVRPTFFFLYTSKIAIGSRKKTQLKDRLFLLRPNFLPLTVGRNFSYTSLSRGFIWSSPIVRKTPQPLQQTSWVRQVSHRVQDLVALGWYFIQESGMWNLPLPFTLKEEARTPQDNILAQEPGLAI